jgi:ABC-type glutathione transport system ATPase component
MADHVVVDGLTIEFPTEDGAVRAADGLSFRLPAGARMGLVGESGSGKTTTALGMLRLLRPPGRVVGAYVMVARAMAMRPAVLVADEPVSMVDASLRATILAHLAAMRDAKGVSIISVTHDLTTAYRVADRLIVLYRGHVVETGTPGVVAAVALRRGGGRGVPGPSAGGNDNAWSERNAVEPPAFPEPPGSDRRASDGP